MQTYIIKDKHNPAKGHHIKFKASQVFYNQAIDQGAIKRGTGWKDFYKDEKITCIASHGYAEYIKQAITLHNKRKNAMLLPVNYFSRIRQAQAQGASFKTCAMFAFLASYQEWCWAKKRLALANKGKASKAVAMRMLNEASARMQQRKAILDKVRG